MEHEGLLFLYKGVIKGFSKYQANVSNSGLLQIIRKNQTIKIKIELRGIKVYPTIGKKSGFVLIKNKQKYWFRCVNENERIKWTTAINKFTQNLSMDAAV